VEIYGGAREVTDDNIRRRMRFACLITKATKTPPKYVILLFYGSKAYTSAPHCYDKRTAPVYLNFKFGGT
jgi:hypothetical protein